MLPLRRQLQLILAQAAYKAHSVYLLPPIDFLPTHSHPTLALSTPIAALLHHHHSLSHFRYTSKGTTPLSIAQEIAIYAHSSPHYSLDIDSFGNILIALRKEYAEEEMRREGGKVGHGGLDVREIPQQQWGRQEKGRVVVAAEDLGMGTLRKVGYLQALGRKMEVFGEVREGEVERVLDVRGLGEKEVIDLLRSGLVRTDRGRLTLVVKPGSILSMEGVGGVQVVNNLERLEMHNGEVISGCLSHMVIPFIKQYPSLLPPGHEPILFGDITPNITLLQLLSASTTQPLRVLLQYPTRLPLNLHDFDSHPKDHSLKEDLARRAEWQKFLLILDAIGYNRLSAVLNIDIHSSLPSHPKLANALSQQISLLLP